MPRLPLFSHPFLLGFDQFERALDRVAKGAGEGYPPYNVEQVGEHGLRITLAVAGFSRDELTVALEDRQLVISGKQREGEPPRNYLYRGIAARQFQRSFLLAEGIEVRGAELQNGLLHVDLARPEPERLRRTIEIRSEDDTSKPLGRRIDVSPLKAVGS